MFKKTLEETFLTYKEYQIPLKIYREWRKSVRASFGRNHVIFRLPIMMTKREQHHQFENLTLWAQNYLDTNEDLRNRFLKKSYTSGDILKVGSLVYKLHIIYETRRTHSAQLKGNTIILKLNKAVKEPHLSKNIRQLLSRTIAKIFQLEIEKKVDYWNDRYFHQEISAIRLKYNKSHWGSCSSKGNINLSTRLLFAPPEVIDYVIIHELAHTKEMSHNSRFWSIVSNIMPDYKEKEKWLKLHGSKCDF